MWIICKKEWNQFFSSLTGYIAIILFLLINGLFLFILKDNILDFGYASLDSFFQLAPWVLIFLIPALSMRSLTDEHRSGTLEILQTKPLSRFDIVFGKYLAILLILLLVLISTCTYVITIQILSDASIDRGGIAGSYLGLFFLGAVFSAISLCCSSVTDNAIVAFLFSAFVCIIMYFGCNSISSLPIFSNGADYYIEMIGIDFHYNSISRGVLDTRDIFYFLSLIFLFLSITIRNLRKK
jgi:ABC-2 type transport system permease protein